jgi:hypothetical protein
MTPERIAGATELVEFIDAPEMKARNKISRPTLPLKQDPQASQAFGMDYQINGCH